MDCYHCKEELLWNADEDYTWEDETPGIQTMFSCQNENCEVETTIVITKNKNVEDEQE